jgi:hypothetical protein
MELYKSNYRHHENGINKFNLDCEKDKNKWLNLVKILYKKWK